MTTEEFKQVSEALRKTRSMAQSSEATEHEINFMAAKIDEASIVVQTALLAADQAKAPPDRERLAGQIAQMRKWLGHRSAKTELTGFEMLASTIADACDDLLRLPAVGECEEMLRRLQELRALAGLSQWGATVEAAIDLLRRLSPVTAGEEMRERAAKVADAHRARIANHNPDDQSGDLVAHGYGNAALNIAVEIRRLS